jgi:diacylglycerol diphosphate phosphatase/phosphatidate phosphatase
MPANAKSSHRRIANDMLNSPGFIGAAARFWQVRTAREYSCPWPGANMRTQRSYASDYVGLAILIAGYILVSTWKPLEELKLTRKVQIQFLAEPFHRMFFLDNLAIGYPHAEVERVSVCAFTAADFLACNANLDV